MEQKTKVTAEPGRQDIQISRIFDLPAPLLFKAFKEPELVAQWMGTKVLKLEFRNHGSFRFETTGPKGNTMGFNGTIHLVVPDQKIIRTFEMEGMPFGVQLEVYTFETLTPTTSKLLQHLIYQSEAHRAENLKLPFVQGINWAHHRLEDLIGKLR